jgi:predicted enzyme related to lactoylglutathione lyase
MPRFTMLALVATAFISMSALGKEAKMPHVTGIGGVFFKAKGDPKVLAAWYQEQLGIKLEPWGGAAFRWPADKAKDKGVTAWKIAGKDTREFSPSESSFMINYRVEDLLGMIANLKKSGVRIVKEPEPTEYGMFASILDPEGNRIELWEP